MDCDVEYLDVNGSSTPRLRWKVGKRNAYPLNHLAKAGNPIRLPNRQPFSLSDLKDQSRILVYGESSGGGRDFMFWLREQLQDGGHPWIFAQGDRWRSSHFKISQKLPDHEDEEKLTKEKLTDFLLGLAKGGAAERSEILQNWVYSKEFEKWLEKDDGEEAGDGKKNIPTLIMRNLGMLGEESAMELAQGLRIACESPDLSERLRILIASTSEHRFEDTNEASGLAPMFERYRLPWLVPEDVRTLAKYFQGNDMDAVDLSDDDTMNEVMLITGGQPLLVHRLLQLLIDKDLTKPNHKDIRQAYRDLRGSPPSVVERSWKHDLRQRCEGSREIRDAIQDYVAGYTQSYQRNLPQSHLKLMIPGWIRLDSEIRRWKVSSKLHADFARKVLD